MKRIKYLSALFVAIFVLGFAIQPIAASEKVETNIDPKVIEYIETQIENGNLQYNENSRGFPLFLIPLVPILMKTFGSASTILTISKITNYGIRFVCVNWKYSNPVNTFVCNAAGYNH